MCLAMRGGQSCELAPGNVWLTSADCMAVLHGRFVRLFGEDAFGVLRLQEAQFLEKIGGDCEEAQEKGAKRARRQDGPSLG